MGSDREDSRHHLGLARSRYRSRKLGKKSVEFGTKSFVGQAMLWVKRFLKSRKGHAAYNFSAVARESLYRRLQYGQPTAGSGAADRSTVGLASNILSV